MAKKKRKHFIKLNNRVREFFGNLSFDQGVETLSDDELLELMLLLGEQDSTLGRDSSIKALRRIWSESGYEYRKLIVDHLTGKNPILDATLTPNRIVVGSRIDEIMDIISTLDCTMAEEEHLLESFLDKKKSKITREKIANKLRYMRIQKRLEYFELELDFRFDTLDRMEFYALYPFEFPEYSFTKRLTTYSDPIDIATLLDSSIEDALVQLSLQRQRATDRMQRDIDTLLESLSTNRYLSMEQSYSMLKVISTDSQLHHAPLDLDIILHIVSAIDDSYFLTESLDHFIIEDRRVIELFGADIPYRVSVSYEKRYLYAQIWSNQKLTISHDLDEINIDMMRDYTTALEELLLELEELSAGLGVSSSKIEEFIRRFVEPQLAISGNLKIKDKAKRRVLFHFEEYLRPLREQRLREELLAKTIRDFKNLFPLARSLNRKITFHVGPTNSGKTYAAMQRLSSATTGYYLAPLRLLALEGYESMRRAGITVSLITGEEEIVDDESTHISSTIEMLNLDVDVDICVIDEIQMVSDRDRGWAWANALIGTPAKELILTGSADALKAVSEVVAYLGEELEVVHFERKNPLVMMKHPTPIKNIEPQSAIVAFSRKEVLSYKHRLSQQYKVSVVYGNLSPEVRREEARKFREGETEVLVATDAIAMGLNLPIKSLLFSRDNKFDGVGRRELSTTEVLQISGRAGRYGMEECGYVGALDGGTLQTIENRFYSSLPDIELPFLVMASLDHVMLIGEILQTEELVEILSFFADNMEFDGPFEAANIDSMLEVAQIVGEYDLDLRAKYHLSCAPVSINSPYIESVFKRYLKHLERDEPILYIPPRELPPYAITNDELLNAEDRVKEVSLYLWLSFKFADKFLETQKAIEARVRLNRFIELSLQKGDFSKSCKRCGKKLDFAYRYAVCDKCHAKGRAPSQNSRRSGYRGRRR